MRNQRRRIAIILMAAAATACSSSDDTSETTTTDGGSGNHVQPDGGTTRDGQTGTETSAPIPGTKLTVAEYCQKSTAPFKAWCDYTEKCCSAADKASMKDGTPFCTEERASQTDCVADYEKQINDKLIEWHGEYAEDCLAKTAALIPAAPSTCQGWNLKKYATFRDKLLDAVPSCREMLRGLLASGADCDYGYDCQPGLTCREISEQVWKCGAAAKKGETCGLTDECEDGLVCVGETGTAKCEPPHAQGAACIMEEDCELGLMCDQTCQKPIATGGDCENAPEACDYGLFCDFDTNKCAALGAVGTTCTEDYDCNGRCDTATKKCANVCGGPLY